MATTNFSPRAEDRRLGLMDCTDLLSNNGLAVSGVLLRGSVRKPGEPEPP